MPIILVVDDMSDDLNAMEQGAQAAIAALGGEVIRANTAESAIDRLKERPFDVVVTDLQLTPDKNYEGWDILQYARKLTAATKVIVVTAYHEPEQDVKSLTLGAFGYLNKIKGDLIAQTKNIILDALKAS